MKRFRGGLGFVSVGRGARPLVVFDGLWVSDEPQPLTARTYRFLGDAYTVYVVSRRRGMPSGYSLADMADDYAAMIAEEFEAPVDVLGVSTGGSIALHVAGDHPGLVRRLVLHSAAVRLSEEARRAQRESARLAGLGEWPDALAQLISPSLWGPGPMRTLGLALIRPVAWFLTRRAPRDPSDYITTIEAEDALDFAGRLGEITAPTLVVSGARDPFYSPSLFRETAEGIPDATLVLYEGQGHVPSGREFQRDVRAFLLGERS